MRFGGATKWALAALLLVALVPLFGERYYIDLTTQILIYALFAMSLNILVGYCGNLSFGHAAFFAIGGYSCVILITTHELPLAVSLGLSVVISAAAAAAIGYVCVRLAAMHFAMLTLAFSMLVWSVAIKWTPVTGGDDGFVGATIPALISTPVSFFYFALLIFAGGLILLRVICTSTFGRAMIAIRENETRATFMGIHVRKVRLQAFTIAGAFAGLAGALLGLYNRGMYPESAFWTESGQVLIMVLLGGMHSFIGPVLGAAALYILETVINQYTEYWQIVLGVILLGVVLIAPDGLAGLLSGLKRRKVGSESGVEHK